MKADKPILFFDGQCNLCNGFVDFLVKVDKKKAFHIASLQGKTAENLLEDEDRQELKSVVLYKNGHLYHKSSALFQMVFLMGGVFWIFAPFWIVPRFFTNWIYDFVALNRYRVFGRRQSCRLPTSEEQEYFLD
jgi:predicted DCC family thiol-disulfide oxidoreductase YuxK